MKDYYDGLFGVYVLLVIICIICIIVICVGVHQIMNNECKNSPVEQFRNSEYCEVRR